MTLRLLLFVNKNKRKPNKKGKFDENVESNDTLYHYT